MTEEEINFIRQFRTNDSESAERVREQQERDVANEEPSVEEDPYVRVFTPTSTLNSVHDHCLGIVPLEPLELREAVEEVLEESKRWTGPQKKMVHSPLSKVMSILGEKLIGENDLPQPTSFSPDRVVESYTTILERHLVFTKVLLKRKSKGRKTCETSTSEDDDSTEKGSSSRKASKEEQKALKAVTKEIEESLRIGLRKYTGQHLYKCERLLVMYKQYQNPEDDSEQPST